MSRAELTRRGLRLEYATLGWNVVGAVLLIATARATDSIALAGFALDSAIEIFASLVVVWQLTGAPEGRERRAIRLIGVAFLAVAGYVLVTSMRALLVGDEPGTSALGTAWVATTVVAMLGLAAGKRSVGTRLGNPVLVAESTVTVIDACLAAAVLLGLLANAVLGWSWADPAAALMIVCYAIREGAQALISEPRLGIP
jgi:divalent metal cation (Fe/Co/Zn/Cd) transporter